MGALPVLDQYGQPALSCAVDGSGLVLAPGESTVLVCAKCGYRTDQPGAGVLGDGFDVAHRQWGTRGDPHAWALLREFVAATPTPLDVGEVRAAYVAALARVVGVNIETADDQQVIRGDLDHGGMSGGMVSLDWWRDKGIPLLVDRAVDRRPVGSASVGAGAGGAGEGKGVRSAVAGLAMWLVVAAIPLALVGGGGWLLYQRFSGTQVEATIITCDSSVVFRRFGGTHDTDCIAEWTIDGETVMGGFEGGNDDWELGRKVDATVRGDTAYSTSLVLPLVLIALGLPFLLLLLNGLRYRVRARRVRRLGIPAKASLGSSTK